MNYYLSLVFYVGVSLVSILFLLRQYRKATPAVRRQIVAAGIGALAVAAIVLVFIASR